MQIIMPIPANAPQSDFTHREHGQPSHVHTYCNHDGEPLFYVCRYEWQDNNGNRQKTFSPLTLWENDSGSLVWQHKAAPAPRPLYGLEQLASNPPAGFQNRAATFAPWPHSGGIAALPATPRRQSIFDLLQHYAGRVYQ